MSGVTVFTSAGPDDLEALHDEICRTFGAIHCPSLDALDAMLRKHGWAPQIREIRMSVEPEELT